MRTYEERNKAFQEGVAKLIKEHDIEMIPTIAIGTGAIIAQITLLDLRDPEMLRKYGRALIPKVDAPPANPLAN